ncbi:MAG: serine/threonine-protein kinase [Deltaproteobacteria bacterium]
MATSIAIGAVVRSRAASMYDSAGRRGSDPFRGDDEVRVPMVTNQSPPNPHDMIGRDAAGYVIDRMIGEGGMGAVYSAYSPLLGKRAAIKVMLGEYTDNKDVVERFSREAKAAAAIKDLNIIDVYAASRFPQDGRMFIVMPFVEGGSLEALCRQRGPLPIDVTVAIALQVCSGLDAVHAVAIVHRDIKTQNILIAPHHGRQYFVYIVDFGIAKLLDPHLGNREKLTRTHSAVGTVGSMAPEQARGDRDIDARADIYSVGMVLYRMLTGRAPYEDASMYALWEKQANGEPFPRPRSLRADVPPVIDDLIMQCLEVDRGRRPASVPPFTRTSGQVSFFV